MPHWAFNITLPARMDRGTATKIGVIGNLYFSQGIPNGFFRHTVPVVFRDSGVSLEQIALFYPALYAPWMLKFLWTNLGDLSAKQKPQPLDACPSGSIPD